MDREQLLAELQRSEMPDHPLFDTEVNAFILRVRKALMADKVEAMPLGPTPEDNHNFVVLSNRIDAQIELCNYFLYNLIHSNEQTEESQS